jgi:hypothetical protein
LQLPSSVGADLNLFDGREVRGRLLQAPRPVPAINDVKARPTHATIQRRADALGVGVLEECFELLAGIPEVSPEIADFLDPGANRFEVPLFGVEFGPEIGQPNGR